MHKKIQFIGWNLPYLVSLPFYWFLCFTGFPKSGGNAGSSASATAIASSTAGGKNVIPKNGERFKAEISLKRSIISEELTMFDVFS